jgi:hypothetical protein
MSFFELARRHEGTKVVPQNSREAPSNPTVPKFELRVNLKMALRVKKTFFATSCLRASQKLQAVQL